MTACRLKVSQVKPGPQMARSRDVLPENWSRDNVSPDRRSTSCGRAVSVKSRSSGYWVESKPASWSQVWRQVNRHLMRLVSGIPRLLVEAVEGAGEGLKVTIRFRGGILKKVLAMYAKLERID